MPQCLVHGRDLLCILLVALVALLRRVHHEIHADLALQARAELDGRELVDLIHCSLVKVDNLEEASSATAFSDLALRKRVERDELEIVGIRLAHLLYDLLERVKRPMRLVENVGLVYLVRHEDELLLICKSDNVLHLLESETLSRRVARIDDDECTHVCTF